VVAPQAPDLALDTAVLVGALKARGRELRAEQVVRAQRDEPIGLHAPAAAQDLLDRRGQVVEADLLEGPAEPVERLDVQLEERLLGLDQRRLAERRPGERRAHEEQMHLRAHPRQVDLRLAPVDLGPGARRVSLGDEDLADRPAHRPLARAHVLAHRRLRDVGAVLIDQPPPDPPRGMALLARRLPVGLKPRVDQRPPRTQLRRRPPPRHPARWRQRRRQRRPDRAAMHTVARRQRADRQPLPVAVAPDLLEQLHPGTYPFRDLPSGLRRARTVRDRTEVGPVQAITVGPVQTVTPITPSAVR